MSSQQAPAVASSPTTSTTTATPSTASSTATTATTAGEDRSAAFAAKDGGSESVPGGSLMVAAYAIVWAVVLLLVVRVFQRQNAVARQLGELEADLRQRARE